MKISTLAVVVGSVIMLSGCEPSFLNPLENPKAPPVSAVPYLGTWRLVDMLPHSKTKLGSAYITVKREKYGLSVVGSEKASVSSVDKILLDDLVLCRLGKDVIASMRRLQKPPTRPNRWNYYRLTLQDNSKKLEIAILDPESFKNDVKSGLLAGTVELAEGGDVSDRGEIINLRVNASPAKVRSYLKTRAHFVKFLVFSKVESNPK